MRPMSTGRQRGADGTAQEDRVKVGRGKIRTEERRRGAGKLWRSENIPGRYLPYPDGLISTGRD